MILSLYDFTGEAVKPWAQMGFKCVCFDTQHSRVVPRVEGNISYIYADLYDTTVLSEIAIEYMGIAKFLMAWPDCTDMAVSGSKHFERKRCADPLFQLHASNHARMCADLADALQVPYLIENPRSVLSTLWRKPNYSFDPSDYGGYLAEHEAQHPKWPDYIADYDAYPKKTYLWTGGIL